MDDNDPFHEAAFCGTSFICRTCGTILDSEDERLGIQYPNDGWIECLAEEAKASGWEVNGELKTLCPNCARHSQE